MSDLEGAVRLLVSLLFGTLVGLERQWHHKTAGLKTNTLVALGATAFTLIAERGFGPHYLLPQVAAGVVTGIGFIGGGVIMRRGANVQGINSAATLWATASMGLAIGAGFFRLAAVVLVLVLATQFFESGLAAWIDRRSHYVNPQVTYRFTAEFAPATAARVEQAWAEFAGRPGVSVFSYSLNAGRLETRVALSQDRIGELTGLTRRLAGTEGATSASWSAEPVDAGP